MDFGFMHSSRKLNVYDKDGLLSHAVLDAHLSISRRYPSKMAGAKVARKDLANSTISGVAFF